MGMKIRGVFDQHSEAVEYVKRLIKLDPTFDIYICDLYNWCLVPPDPEHVQDQQYQDESLNSLISEYRRNQIYAKEHFEERKREFMEQAADEARSAALKKIQEESQEELDKAGEELSTNEVHVAASSPAENRIIDITEIEAQGETVSASEIMDQLIGKVTV